MPVDYSDVDFEQEARRRLEAVTAGEPVNASDVPVENRVAEGHPARVLVDAAEGAELLVVGSHGHGTFAGMVLGSTGHYCAQHAPCPIVIVPLRTQGVSAASPRARGT